MSEWQTIKLEQTPGIAHIILNRPKCLNAINGQMISELNGLLDDLASDDSVGAIVLSGAGRAFSSGMDLKEDAAEGPRDAGAWRSLLSGHVDFLMRFWDHPKPTIAAVHGYCLAAGCELAMCCDITIADEDTILGEPELLFGSVITAMMMPWLTGPKIAKELLLAADDQVTAARAERIGLVNRVAPPGRHVEEALALARRMAVMDEAALRLTKEAINRCYDIMGLKPALQANLDLAVQIETLDTPSRRTFRELVEREGMAAALKWRNGRLS
ncbi:MAG: enoyl-CoA hydratase/isomerase family protein [Pseudomonadota bacterium]